MALSLGAFGSILLTGCGQGGNGHPQLAMDDVSLPTVPVSLTLNPPFDPLATTQPPSTPRGHVGATEVSLSAKSSGESPFGAFAGALGPEGMHVTLTRDGSKEAEHSFGTQRRYHDHSVDPHSERKQHCDQSRDPGTCFSWTDMRRALRPIYTGIHRYTRGRLTQLIT
jgi:hypothetical protein